MIVQNELDYKKKIYITFNAAAQLDRWACEKVGGQVRWCTAVLVFRRSGERVRLL